MRWDSLRITEEDSAQLPGYREPAVVRHFDAPEALDVRFYEVRAKSALNRVPEASRMPFRWTVNPYRGCTHACVYCAAGDTPILMADGRTRALAELSVGDRIVGTERRGRHRRYVTTEVLAHWSTLKPAWRVTLEDGTELVTSGDHRFLSTRGWKFVTGDGRGPDRRPHLTIRDALFGTGRFERSPEDTPDYRRGYLCGLVGGDGTLGSRPYAHADGRSWTHGQLGLALADQEASDRARRFLSDFGVGTGESEFYAASATRRAIRGVRTQRRADAERIGELIRWPLDPTDDWRKGLLAGMFDAEGSSTHDSIRISHTDGSILDWTRACLRHFSFDTVDERTPHDVRPTSICVSGGPKERLRFLHLTDPAITRKRMVQGLALGPDARTRVSSIESLGLTMPMFDITTGTGDFIADGIVSHNCFARPTHKYLDMNAGRDFEREIVVKVNAPEMLRAELARPSWKGDHVAMGTNTDPYQWVESKYRLMPGIWEALRDARNPCSVLTKSPLLLRDLDLLKEVRAVTDLTASLSIPTLDEKAWRASEPHTPHPRKRIEAVAELNRAGIPTGVLIAPLMPGINDDPAQVQAILDAVTEAGATGVGGVALHLRGEVKGIFMDWLRSYRPDLVERYEELYRRGAYAPVEERNRLAATVRRQGGPRAAPFVRDRRSMDDRERGPWGEPSERASHESAPRRPGPVQGALF